MLPSVGATRLCRLPNAQRASLRRLLNLERDHAVSEITERPAQQPSPCRLWAEYEAFTTRDLSEYRTVYLFVDGIAERVRGSSSLGSILYLS